MTIQDDDPYGLETKPIADLQARLIAAAERLDGGAFGGNEYHAALLREADRRLTALAALHNEQPEPPIDVLGIKVKKELFRFHNYQDWVNKAQSRYARCGVPKGYYITVNAAGHIMHMGKCFIESEQLGLYPVIVYEMQTILEI